MRYVIQIHLSNKFNLKITLNKQMFVYGQVRTGR